MIHWSKALRSLVCLLAVWALPSAAHAQDDEYKKGLEAIEDKKWPDAVAHMRRAIELDDKESERKVRLRGPLSPIGIGLGGREEPYLPYYFLGEALLAQKDCVGAIDAWSRSERQGVVRNARVDTIQKGYKSCADQGVLPPNAYDAMYSNTRQKYAAAVALHSQVSSVAAKNKDVSKTQSDDLARTRDELSTSQKRLEEGRRTRKEADFKEAAAIADRVTGELHKLESLLNAAANETGTIVQQTSKTVEQAIAAAEAAEKALDTVGVPLSVSMAVRRKSGRDSLSQARERRAAAEQLQSTAMMNEALAHAQSASSILTDLLAEAKKQLAQITEQALKDLRLRLDEAGRRAQNAFLLADEALGTLKQRWRDPVPEQVTTEREKLEKQIGALKRRFNRASKTNDLAELTETTRLTLEAKSGVDTLIASFGRLTLRDRGVSGALEEGVRLFLAGKYEEALEALETDSAESPLRLHAHLFRAAAHYAIYIVSGESNQTHLTEALKEIERCKQIDSAFMPDQRVFAPRFLTLFHTGRASGTK